MIPASKLRLDQTLVARGMVATRSQAESYIKLGQVHVNGSVARKPGLLVSSEHKIVLMAAEQYVSRAALKLASVAEALRLDFRGKTVLDVGSSTGGFTQYALLRGAKKVIAVEVGTDQLHPSLRTDPRIELHEKTDIRNVQLGAKRGKQRAENVVYIDHSPDLIVADVSFISLREILPHVSQLMAPNTQLIAMVKPQFEASSQGLKHKGVIKNDRLRRDILKGFEDWARLSFVTINKADSAIPGAKGNQERFYLLRKTP